MGTVYRTGNAGSVRLSARTLSDDLSPLDERGNRRQIELCLRERVGVAFSHGTCPDAPACGFRNKARNGQVNPQADKRS